jgi:hypothetical protein
MADLNSSNLKILSKLVQNGFTTEKQILNMGIGDLIRIPKISAAEIRGINEFQKAIKAGNTLSFFVEVDKSQTPFSDSQEIEINET